METIKDGPVESFYDYENDQLMSRLNYKNGKMDGLQEMRNEK